MKIIKSEDWVALVLAIFVVSMLVSLLIFNGCSISKEESKVEIPTATTTTTNPSEHISVSLSYSPLAPTTADTVAFNASVVGGIAPFSYQWNFEGTKYIETTSPYSTYKFSLKGVYIVQVIVIDKKGNTSTSSAIVTVKSI